MSDEMIPASSAVLMAAAFLIGAECKQSSDAYMLCKSNKAASPADCATQGLAVHACVNSLYHCIFDLFSDP